jgi:hypothetical protein
MNNNLFTIAKKAWGGITALPNTIYGVAQAANVSDKFLSGLRLSVPRTILTSQQEAKVAITLSNSNNPSLSIRTSTLVPDGSASGTAAQTYSFKNITANVVSQTVLSNTAYNYQLAEEQSFSYYGTPPVLSFADDTIYHTGVQHVLTDGSGVMTGVSSSTGSFQPLTGELVCYSKAEYPAGTSSVKIIPDNWTKTSTNSFGGILTISTGSGVNEKIVYVSDHDLVTGTAYIEKSGITKLITVNGDGGSSYSFLDYGKTGLRAKFKTVSSRGKNVLPYGISTFTGASINGIPTFTITGTDQYLKQTGNIANTSFYNIYRDRFNMNTGTWNGIIPANTAYSIAYYNTGLVYREFIESGVNLSVFNANVLTPTGLNLRAQALTASGNITPVRHDAEQKITGSYSPRNSDSTPQIDLFNAIKLNNGLIKGIAIKRKNFISSL